MLRYLEHFSFLLRNLSFHVLCIFENYFRIGVAEKGYLTAELSVHTSGGHSSMPPAETSIGIMSKAVVK